MASLRKTALVAGLFYLLTFVSIPTLFLYNAVRAPSYILGPGPDTGVLLGAILEIIVGLAGIGTAVALFPVVKRWGEGVALGFVASRTLEAATLFAGVAALLAVVSLRQAGAGAGALAIGQTLVVLYDRTFLFGGSFMPAVNGVLLGYLMYRSRLVPRALPVIGFVGVALLVSSDIAKLFGLVEPRSSLDALSALPIAVWEFSLGVYLVVKGFKSSAITAAITSEAARPASEELRVAA